MTKRPLVALVVLISAVLLTGCGGQAATVETPTAEAMPAAFTNPQEAFANPEASEEDLIYAWFGLLALTGRGPGEVATSSEEVEAGMKTVRPYLDPAFTLMRATGQRYTAGNYVPLDIDAFELSDFVVTEPREDIRVIRFFVSQPGATAPDEGVVMSGDKAPRIAVLRWDDEQGHWVIVSYANFNSAIAAICEQAPIQVRGETPVTSPEDLALGTSLAERNAAVATGKSTQEVASPAYQVQFADGSGWPTTEEVMIDDWTPAESYEFANLGVARNGDLLVLSYDAKVKDVVIEGEDYRDTASPRLITYLQNPEGEWEKIAQGSFNVPEGVPSDVDCVSVKS